MHIEHFMFITLKCFPLDEYSSVLSGVVDGYISFVFIFYNICKKWMGQRYAEASKILNP